MENVVLSKKIVIALLILIVSISFAVFMITYVPQTEDAAATKITTVEDTTKVEGSKTNTATVQDIYVKALDTGFYDNLEITVKKGIPVRLHFTADIGSGCGKYLAIDDFGIKLISKNGEEKIAEFTPQSEGVYYYHCGMWMFKGKLTVIS